MVVTVNGRQVEVTPAATVLELLGRLGVTSEHVAVALEGEIVPRERYGNTPVREGAEVEIVHLMAGGAEPVRVAGIRSPARDGAPPADDALVIAGKSFSSRLMVGTGKYADLEAMRAAIEASGAEIVTVSVRYMNLEEGPAASAILGALDLSRIHLLPNTAGAATAEQAIRMARLAREATGTNWVKLEVIGDAPTLWPDTDATIEATRVLVQEGFIVLPYTSPDLVAALRLEDAGASTVMPLGAPIGTGQGLIDWMGIRRIIERVTVPVVVDAGIGLPSHAARAMELGAAAVLVNTAIARAEDPVGMARAMRLAVEAGRLARRSGPMRPRNEAEPSSPTAGVPGAVAGVSPGGRA